MAASKKYLGTRVAPASTTSAVTRVAIYGRVSTPDQHVEVQVEELKALAVARRLSVVGIYTDVGISGVKSSRPGLDRMMKDAVGGKFDMVLTYKIDRIGRSLQHLLAVIEQLTQCGVGFESAHDPGISTTSATGTLMLSICGAFAAYERSILIERTRSGVARAKALGKHCGRPRRDLDLRAARLLLGQGQSVRAVASMLGVPRGTLQRHLSETDAEVAQKSPSVVGAPSP